MYIDLGLRIANVQDQTRESLLKALSQLGESDNDFSGENGPEYLWNNVWIKNGFKDYDDWQSKNEPALLYDSNLKYTIEAIRSIEDDKECIETFFEDWLMHDSYYDGYTWETIEDNDEKLVAIALATVHS